MATGRPIPLHLRFFYKSPLLHAGPPSRKVPGDWVTLAALLEAKQQLRQLQLENAGNGEVIARALHARREYVRMALDFQ